NQLPDNTGATVAEIGESPDAHAADDGSAGAILDIFSGDDGRQMGIAYASRGEIIALQTQRAKTELRHAYYNVPHYRRKFDEIGVHPDDFKELSDMAKFPFTDKSTLRAEYPFGMFAVGQHQIARIHASSGTTGRPTVVGYTHN